MYVVERAILVFTNLVLNLISMILILDDEVNNACKYYYYAYRSYYVSYAYAYLRVLQTSHHPIWNSKATASFYVLLVIYCIATVNDISLLLRTAIFMLLYLNAFYCIATYLFQESFSDVMKSVNSDKYNEIIVYSTVWIVLVFFCVPLIGYVVFGDKDNTSLGFLLYHMSFTQITFLMFMICYTLVPRILLNIANDKVIFLKRNLRRFSSEVKRPVEEAQRALTSVRQVGNIMGRLGQSVPPEERHLITQSLDYIIAASNGIDVALSILDDAMEVCVYSSISMHCVTYTLLSKQKTK